MSFDVPCIDGKRRRSDRLFRRSRRRRRWKQRGKWQEQEEMLGDAPYALRPLRETAVRHDHGLRVSSAPPRLRAERMGSSIAPGPVTAVHSDMGVLITAPPRTAASILVPMASSPVTRQLAFNTMSPQLGARRSAVPDKQVALYYVHLAIFAQRLHPINHTLDEYVWVATLEDNWGVDMWPGFWRFTARQKPQWAGRPVVLNSTHRRCMRS
eukprot:849950-Pleurochrysis_carterae.AAC.1